MKRETIVRAWKDPQFRASLTTEERSALPECPAGTAFTELDEGELADAVGGALYQFDDLTCICSDWTVPITTTKTIIVNPRDTLRFESTVVLDQGALATRGF